ncbi:MAG: tetratricopeptide repeat protein [Chloroflexi bacterium]|nr:tetratricopeptide repeat protein [Chloroflexota bacterium]
MHKFVQSAIDAAKQGDKNKAMSFLKEVLSANPKDIDAWLVLAAVMDDPQRKRQCLNRVLTLDPTNKLAREELLEMDRAAMGATPPFVPEEVPIPESSPRTRSQPSMSLESRPLTQPARQQATHVSLPDWAEEPPKAKLQAASQPGSSAKPRAEKPMVFKYSTINRIATYFFAILFACLGLAVLILLQNVMVMVVPCGLSLLLLPAIWIVSKQVEVSEKGIRTSQFFGLIGAEVGWNEIARIQSKQNNLALVTKKGNTVNVTKQVIGYPTIVETLRQRRPDLFGMAQSASVQGDRAASTYGTVPSMGYDIPSAAPSFSGTRTFKKNFFKQYGILFLVIPFCLVALWTIYAEPEHRIGAILAAIFCLIIMILPFFQVGLVKVEPNKLSIESFFEQKEFSGRDIREIKMQSVRGRYGRVTNYVDIVTVAGKNYPVQGFSDGDEIIYGILHQWWEAYRNR